MERKNINHDDALMDVSFSRLKGITKLVHFFVFFFQI